MAERLAATFAARRGISGLAVSSAGTQARVSHAIHSYAAQVLKNLGSNPSDFRARQLTPRIVSTADVVLTMTKEQRDKVLELAPSRLRQTFTLGEAALLASTFDIRQAIDLAAFRPRLAADSWADIPDPIGKDADYFAMVGSKIAELLIPVLDMCSQFASTGVD